MVSRPSKQKPVHVTDFQKKIKKIYELVSRVPKGKVTTYGAIAAKLSTSPRAVGQALKKNPFAPKVPCHRVISSDGSIGGFKGRTRGKAIREKIRLLKREGVSIRHGRVAEKNMSRKL